MHNSLYKPDEIIHLGNIKLKVIEEFNRVKEAKQFVQEKGYFESGDFIDYLEEKKLIHVLVTKES